MDGRGRPVFVAVGSRAGWASGPGENDCESGTRRSCADVDSVSQRWHWPSANGCGTLGIKSDVPSNGQSNTSDEEDAEQQSMDEFYRGILAICFKTLAI